MKKLFTATALISMCVFQQANAQMMKSIFYGPSSMKFLKSQTAFGIFAGTEFHVNERFSAIVAGDFMFGHVNSKPLEVEARANTGSGSVMAPAYIQFSTQTLLLKPRYYLTEFKEEGSNYYGDAGISLQWVDYSFRASPLDEVHYSTPYATQAFNFNLGVGLAAGYQYNFSEDFCLFSQLGYDQKLATLFTVGMFGGTEKYAYNPSYVSLQIGMKATISNALYKTLTQSRPWMY